jgi:D-alanine-D-alanine ligase
VDENGATLEIPAQLSTELSEKVRALSIAAFRVLNCVGMARVDFFLADDGRLLVNEINTIPGFTNISMFPLLWEASGVSYSDLIDRLITLALRRHAALNKLSYEIQTDAPTAELSE